jgi:hypothetical protein
MENKSLLNKSNILTPHKPLGQDLPSLQFMWPLGAQPLNILDTSIQQKRQQSSSQDLSWPFAKSPFFSARSAPSIQRNVLQDDFSSLNTQLKREYSDINISPQTPQSINELEYSENTSENLVDDQPSFDDNQAFVDAANFSGEIDVNQSTRSREIANPQQSIELESSIPTPRISPQVQPEEISLSKASDDSIIFPINEVSSANHNASTNLDLDEDLGLQDNPIDLPTDPTVSVDSPIDLNLKIDQNPSSALSTSPPVESYPEPSIQESTISTTPAPLISSSSAQSEVVPDGYKQIENQVVNDISESLGVDVVLDSTSNQIHRQSEIQAPIDIANTSVISTSSIAPTTAPSQLDLTSVSTDSQEEIEPERIVDIQPSAVDSNSFVINTSPSSEVYSNPISQETPSLAHQESDTAISDPPSLISPIPSEMSAIIAASPIAPPQSPQVDRTSSPPQTSSQDTEEIGIDRLNDSNNDTIISESSLDLNIISPQFEPEIVPNSTVDVQPSFDNVTILPESSLSSSIISPQFEPEIQTSADTNNNSQLSFNTDESSLAEPSQTNTLPDLSQALNATSNSESEISEVQLTAEKPTGIDVKSSLFTKEVGQEFEFNDTGNFIDNPFENPSSNTNLVTPARAVVNQSNQSPSNSGNIDISTKQLAPSINRSLVDKTSAPPVYPIQLSPDVEEFDPFGQAPKESNATDVDLSLQSQPQQLRSAETDFGVPGQDLDTSSPTIDIQPSSLSRATSPGELPEPVLESSETSFIAPSIDTSSSTINSDINQSVADLPLVTDHIESTDSHPSSIQDGNIAELNSDVNNITETGLVNNPVQRRIESTAESTSIDPPLIDSINRFSDPAPPIDQEPVNAEDADRTNQLPEINHETLDSADVLETETQQSDDFELPTAITNISDNSDSLAITTAMPQVLQKLSILDPQLTQPRHSGQSTNTPLNFTPPLLSSSPAASTRIQRSTSTTTDRMDISPGSYSPVLQRFSAEDYSSDRFDDQTNSSDMTSSWGSVSDLLSSPHIDGNPNSFTSASSSGQPIIQPKPIRRLTPNWNEERPSPELLNADQAFANLRPYDSLPQSTSRIQDAESISSNPTPYIAKLNGESQLVSGPNSIMEASEQTHSASNTKANQNDSLAGLEQLAQVTYRLIQQKIAIERERSGGYYSGRLPW